MRVRKIDSDGDYVFGHGSSDFHRDSPAGVAQCVKTRLGLFAGEWFLDTSYGMPWGGFAFNANVVSQGRVLGKGDVQYRDLAIKTCVLNTQGVLSITSYSSILDANRRLSVSITVDTLYGGIQTQVAEFSGYTFTLDSTPLDSTIPLG
jgi:hypothetical protein